jgi:pyridoxal phosphate enzyme (YggS family)
MHDSVKNLNLVKNKVNEIVLKKQLKTSPQIIIVTKTFQTKVIMPLIEYGHIHYGENKIQEAENKWLDIKKKYQNIKLHMLGKIQSNKAKKAVELFDYVHSLDSKKLADKLSMYERELNKKIKIFIQVNIAQEHQKSGIDLKDLKSFYEYTKNSLSLNIIGLMCLPPLGEDPDKFFYILKKSAKELGLKELSMGMSGDYEKATLNESTYLRLGTAILGKRVTI